MESPEQLPPPESKEKKKDFSDLAIVTTTMYKDDETSRVRQALALKLFSNAEKLGAHVYVMDGGSNDNFLEQARLYNNIHLEINPALSMGASRRAALDSALTASDAPYILWVEPGKDDLIQTENLKTMIEGLRKNQTDIVVPQRKDLTSMPKFQAWIEQRANKRVAALDQKAGPPEAVEDLWFGPKMFNRDGAQFFSNYRGQLDKWDSIIKPVLEAKKAGKRISSVDVDYHYDPSQQEAEEHDRAMKQKRVEQYSQVLAELGDQFWQNRNQESRSIDSPEKRE